MTGSSARARRPQCCRRLFTLVWWPGSFKFMHVYLWQSITLLAVSGLFMAWLRFSPPDPARA